MELQHEIELLRGVLQFIGDELAQLNPSPTRVFVNGHVVFYDGSIGRYVLDYTVPMDFEDLLGFLNLGPTDVQVDRILRLCSIVPIGPKKV